MLGVTVIITLSKNTPERVRVDIACCTYRAGLHFSLMCIAYLKRGGSGGGSRVAASAAKSNRCPQNGVQKELKFQRALFPFNAM